MKKFMKALALALALCMVLSVSAFAALVEDEADGIVTTATRTIDFTITGFETTEQVALLVLKTGKTPSTAAESDILYIDQKLASSGSVTFAAAIAEGTDNDVVDVYVGSTSISAADGPGAGEAWDVYKGVVIAETSSITIAGEAKKLNVNETAIVNGAEVTITRPGAAIGITINNLTPAKMVWALRGTKDGETEYKYSKPVDIDLTGVETDAPIWFTGIFSSSVLEGFTIDKVAAIFQATDASEHYVGDADEQQTIMGHKKAN